MQRDMKKDMVQPLVQEPSTLRVGATLSCRPRSIVLLFVIPSLAAGATSIASLQETVASTKLTIVPYIFLRFHRFALISTM